MSLTLTFLLLAVLPLATRLKEECVVRLLTGDASNGRRIRSLNCKGHTESFFRFFPSRHCHQFLGQQVLGCRFRGHSTDHARVGRRSTVVRLTCAVWSPVLCRTDVRSVVLLPPVKSVLTSVDTLTQRRGCCLISASDDTISNDLHRFV